MSIVFRWGVRAMVFGALVGIVGAGLLVRWALTLSRSTSTEGFVRGRRVESAPSSSSGSSHPLYRVGVDFTFEANGRPVNGHGTATYWTSHREEAEAELSRFPVGSTHPIRYRTNAPEEVTFDGAGGLLMPLGSLFGGVLVFNVGSARRRREQRHLHPGPPSPSDIGASG